MNRYFQRTAASGSVLILALWVVCFLSMLAIAVASGVWRNMAYARYMKLRVAAYCVARSGVEAAVFEAATDTNAWDYLSEPWRTFEDRFVEVAVGDGQFTVFYLSKDDAGSVVTNFGLMDEESRFNIHAVTNAAGREIFRSMLQLTAGMDDEAAEVLAARVSDWIDSDVVPLEKGGETAKDGRMCHNDRITRLDELIAVRGMTTNVLSGIRDHVTVHGYDARININTAGKVVLKSMAGARRGLSDDARDALVTGILAFREDGGRFESDEKKEIRQELFGDRRRRARRGGEWAALEWLINHGMVTVQSRHFYGISVGTVDEGSSVGRRIAFVYDRKQDEFRAWHEN